MKDVTWLVLEDVEVTFDQGFILSPAVRLLTTKTFSGNDTNQTTVLLSYKHYDFLRLGINVDNLGVWTMESGLRCKTSLKQCCFNLRGYRVNVLTLPDSAPHNTVEHENGNIRMSGLVGDLFTIIMKKLAMRYGKVNIMGYTDTNTSYLSSIYDNLRYKKYDIVVIAHIESLYGRQYADFSIGYIRDGFGTLYKKRDDYDLWSFYWKPFSEQSWILIIPAVFTLLLIAHLISYFIASENMNISVMEVLGATLNQGCDKDVKLLSCKVYFFAFLLHGFLLTSFYSTKIVSVNTVMRGKASLQSFEDVAASDQYSPIIWANGQMETYLKESPHAGLKKVWKKISEDKSRFMVSSSKDILDKVENMNAVYIGGLLYLRNIQNFYPSLTVNELDSGMNSLWISLIFPKMSPLKRIFNMKILELMDSGVIDRIKKQYGLTNRVIVDEPHNTISIRQIFIPLIIIVIGVFASLSCLMLEIHVHKGRTTIN